MYTIDQKICTFCAGCSALCPAMAIVIYDNKSKITASCTSCGICQQFCPINAISQKSAPPLSSEHAA